jgi:hypothetical protein
LARGSSGSIVDLLLHQLENPVRTELAAGAAMDADHGFVYFVGPEDGLNQAGLAAVTAAQTLVGIKQYTSSLPGAQGIRGAHLQAGRVFTCPADYHGETPFHPPHRMDTDAGSGQAGRALSAIAGKHATLASYTFFGIFNGKSHNTFSDR